MCSSVYREGFRQSLYTDFGVPLQLIFSPGISCLIFQQLAWNSVLLTPQTSKIKAFYTSPPPTQIRECQRLEATKTQISSNAALIFQLLTSFTFLPPIGCCLSAFK